MIKTKKEKKNKYIITDRITAVTAVVILIIFIKLFVIGPFTVNGPSMEPTLYSGDMVICCRVYNASDLQQGDIIVFRHNGQRMIKRIAYVTEDGKNYYVLGDNKSNSLDSRVFGTVGAGDVKAKMIGLPIKPWIYWPAALIFYGLLTAAAVIHPKKASKKQQNSR